MVIKNTFLRLLGHQRQQQTMKRQTYEMTPGFKPFTTTILLHYFLSFLDFFIVIIFINTAVFIIQDYNNMT